MTISKDDKIVILLLLKLKDDKIFFIGDLEHSNLLLNSKNKNIRIIKVQKSKTWGPSRWSRSLPCLLSNLHVSFLIPQNPLHVILQPLLVPCNGVDLFGRNNVFCHPMIWPSLTDPAQDPIGEHRFMEGTLFIRRSLTLSKLPRDTTSGVVRAASKSN